MILTAIVPGRDGMGFTAQRSLAELHEMLGREIIRCGGSIEVFDLDDILILQRGAIEIRHRGRKIETTGRVFAPTPISLCPLRERKIINLYSVLRERGIPLLNRSFKASMFLEFNKMSMQAFVSSLNIPCIPTLELDGFSSPPDVFKECQELGFELPIILKPNRLSNGIGVLRCDEVPSFVESVRLVQQTQRDYLIQPYLPHVGDLRVFLSRDEIYGFSLRRPALGDFRGNLSSGGYWEEGHLPEEVIEWCYMIAKKCDADYVVLDWLKTSNGFVFNEMCSTLGAFMGLPPLMHKNVAHRIVEICLNKVRPK